MTTTRSYRKAMSVETAREELTRAIGTQFDPVVIDALLEVLGAKKPATVPVGVDMNAPAPAHSAT